MNLDPSRQDAFELISRIREQSAEFELPRRGSACSFDRLVNEKAAVECGHYALRLFIPLYT